MGIPAELLRGVGYAALAVLVVGWLAVSLRPPSPGRAVIERLAATALFVALLCFFLSGAQRAWQDDRTGALVGFGGLTLLFAAGTLVSAVKTALEVRDARRR